MEASTNGRLSVDAFEKFVGWHAMPEQLDGLLLETTLRAFGNNYGRLPTQMERQIVMASAIEALEVRGFRQPFHMLRGAIADGTGTVEPHVHDWKTLDEVRQIEPPRGLVGHVLYEETVTMMYGESETGKSFITVGFAMCVATGTEWHGHAVQQGPVAYVAAEGGRWIVNRFTAWQEVHPTAPEPLLTMLPQPIQFLQAEDRAGFIQYIQTMDPTPKLAIVDTLSQCTVGGSENAVEVMGAFLSAANEVKYTTGATVLATHHPSKGNPNDMRGHGSLRGNVEAILKVTRDDDVVTIEADKTKDWARWAPIKLALVPQGQSCVLTSLSEADVTKGLSANDRQSLEALARISFEDGVTNTDWKKAADLADSSFMEARKRLVTGGWVWRDKQSKRYRPTESGYIEVPSETPF